MFEDTIDHEVDWDDQRLRDQVRWRVVLQKKRKGLA
jgi:hypothetical protein